MRWFLKFISFDAVTVSSMVILGVFSLINIFYSRSKLVKILVHVFYKSSFDICKNYIGRSHFLYFVVFLYAFFVCNNLVGSLSFESVTSDKSIVIFLMALNIFFALCCGFWYKGYRTITDICDPELPLLLRFVFAPLEFIGLLGKIGLVIFRIYIVSCISHSVMAELLKLCSNANLVILQIIMFGIIMFVKFMHIFNGTVYANIFAIQFGILAGKFNKDHHS